MSEDEWHKFEVTLEERRKKQPTYRSPRYEKINDIFVREGIYDVFPDLDPAFYEQAIQTEYGDIPEELFPMYVYEYLRQRCLLQLPQGELFIPHIAKWG